MTSFIGRRREGAALKRLLESSRLVTLTGVGGVGKTRLALRVGEEVRRAFPDGVWFVDLSPLQDPGLVAEEVGVALGLRDHSARWPVEAVTEYLTDKRLLLILDNCEHLLDACALLTSGVLRGAPEVQILATSRQPLGTAGEHVVAMAALSLPDASLPSPPPAAFAQYEALTLFTERARAASSFVVTEENSAAVIELCRALDGLPLALELAAVRLRLLTPEQMLARLDDRFGLLVGGDPSVHPRQRSLQALIDWSFELCTPAEQTLWVRLAVFPGGFDVDAVASICVSDDLDAGAAMTALAGLIDRSLLVSETVGSRMRYRLLETIRQYAVARFEASDEATVLRRRHRDHFHQLAKQAEAEWCSPQQLEWFGRLTTEHDNFRASLAYSLAEPGEERVALDLAGTLRLHWLSSGHLNEGRHWLTRALDAVPEGKGERAKALWVDAFLRLHQDDLPGASAQLKESLRIAEAANDVGALAQIKELEGMSALLSSDWQDAVALSEEAINRHRALGDRFGVIMALSRSAMAAYMMGDTDQALSRQAAALAESEACGESWGRSSVLWMHGVVLFDQGDLSRSEESVRESLLIRDAFGDNLAMARSIEVLAWVAAATKEYDRAARLIGIAEKLWRVSGGKFLPYVHDRLERCHQDTKDALGAKAFAAAVLDGTNQGPADAIAFALGTPVRPARSSSSRIPSTALTPRERQTAELVAAGLSNREIAAQLVVSQRTAEAHVDHILTKLGFSSRAQIAAWVVENRGM
ncbi:MAG TPA: LuxR C-terminal-related transcriptional regulator [Nocardioidaceae bacterium]|nr:LuxR C-terminal-related transcriptional regulator [Nocardioidaceae bacterium]